MSPTLASIIIGVCLYNYILCLATSSKSACPHATCTIIQFKEKIQWKLSTFAAQEKTRESPTSIRNRREEEWLRIRYRAKRSATVETADSKLDYNL